jgi:hypothetical protein
MFKEQEGTDKTPERHCFLSLPSLFSISLGTWPPPQDDELRRGLMGCWNTAPLNEFFCGYQSLSAGTGKQSRVCTCARVCACVRVHMSVWM